MGVKRPNLEDRLPVIEGIAVGAAPAPVDVGVHGNASGYVPPPASPPELDTLSKVGETALGIAQGQAELVLGLAKFTVLNAVTLGGYGTYALGKALWDGFKEDGFLGALNAINPLYAIARGGAETYLAAERGDYRAAGAAGAKVEILAVVTVYGAAEGVGALDAEPAAAGVAAAEEAAAGAAEGVAAAEEGVAATAPTRGGTYVLRDRATGQVMRTGRTNNLVRREAEHARDPILGEFKFDAMDQTDIYAEQRGLEQRLHEIHNPPLNKISPISSSNPLRDIYMDAAKRFLGEQ